ncbi:MAG: 50S ribosomal protein L23 [bacterium]
MGLFTKNKIEDKDTKLAPAKTGYLSNVDKSASVKKEEKKRDVLNSRAYRILIKPLVTEKAANMGVENKYVFEVSPDTNRVEVAKAINDIYNIKPISVNIMNVLGKKVRFGRTSGRKKDRKKAIVTLPKGKTIDVYEGI